MYIVYEISEGVILDLRLATHDTIYMCMYT